MGWRERPSMDWLSYSAGCETEQMTWTQQIRRALCSAPMRETTAKQVSQVSPQLLV